MLKQFLSNYTSTMLKQFLFIISAFLLVACPDSASKKTVSAADLELSPSELDFKDQNSLSLSLKNLGQVGLSWKFGDVSNLAWFKSFSTSSGDLNVGSESQIIITIDRTKLKVGLNEGKLEVILGDGLSRSIPIKAFLGESKSPPEESKPSPEEPKPAPKANFTFNITDKTVKFSNTSQNATTYLWDFGDGKGNSTAKNPTYTYASEGNYRVSLKAKAADGKTASTTRDVTIKKLGGDKPGAIASILSSPGGKIWRLVERPGAYKVGPNINEGVWWSISNADLLTRSCQFDDQFIFTDGGKFAIDTKGDIYHENIIGGNNTCQPESKLKPPFDAFKSSDNYTFEVIEATASSRAKLKVNGKGAHIGFLKGHNGGELRASDKDLPASITYEVFEYSKLGAEETLVVAVNYGRGWWTMTLTSAPLSRKAQANFTFLIADKKVTFTDKSKNAQTYLWKFGDASDSTSNKANPTFTYPGKGTYKVQLTVTSSDGSTSTSTKDITIFTLTIPTTGYTTPTRYAGKTLIWQDEFSGSAIDETKWNYNIGGHGWGNAEWQYYRRENAYVKDGNLVIQAKKEKFDNRDYTSTRMTTKDKFEFKYGRVDIRAALPFGQGIWPALWMLGANFGEVGWPRCGEIDIMEFIGREPKNIYGTLHWADTKGARQCTCHDGLGGAKYTKSPAGIFTSQFHVYSIIWTSTEIRFLVDDNEFKRNAITGSEMEEFHKNFFFLVNLAVGGTWPGYPDNSTTFPQFLIVDYIRVFQ